MVHRHGKLAVAVLVVGMLAGTAVGQNFVGGPVAGAGVLLGNPDVHKELNLTEDQITKAREVSQSVRERMKDHFDKLKKLKPEQQKAQFQELHKANEAEVQKVLKDVFNADQHKRFKQLELQWRGATTFADPEIQQTLKLTDQQKEKIKTINLDLDKEMREAFKAGQGNPKEGMTKIGALRKDGLEKATAVLNADQKKTWKELAGEPFEFKFGPPPGAK
jgi:hypothetical protein